jgi:hypothetical protein
VLAIYLTQVSIPKGIFREGVDCYVDFLDEVPSASKIKKDARASYSKLLSACQTGVGHRILMENRVKQDGIRSCCQLVQQYETDCNRNVRIKRLQSVINTVFNRNYRTDLSNQSKTMKMPLQNCLYLDKRLGMMMKSRSVALYRMHKILVWLIQFL